MLDYELKIKNELENIYRFANANSGGQPKMESPIYKKYHNIKEVLAELSKTNYLEALILTKRYIEAKSYERIAIELCYSVKHIYRLKRKAITLFSQTAMQIGQSKRNE